jgi:hypothetical protein
MRRKGQSTDPDILASLPAMRRAARKARQLAQATRTPVYILRNGRVVNVNPNARGLRRPNRPEHADTTPP